MYVGSWIAAFIVGALVLAILIYSIIKFRRRDPNEVPRQVRYNLPMEFVYTLVPIVIVCVLFFYTVGTQNFVQAKADTNTVHKIDVVGFKWSWAFNYKEAGNPAIGADVNQIGTIESPPTLVLPVNEPVRFTLYSPDVIHSFWVPSFYYKLDVIPGRSNTFDVTPTKLGTFAGKCAELCGTYHSAMLFNVQIVTPQEYQAYLKGLQAQGQTGTFYGPLQNNPQLQKEGN
ncbi:cytochrome c oxidase subunit 2 [Raineyella antarctica]|uniref:cytochrome-c oxidase n=2 Tax=Raineyella antarctica TaxID=1577474 RepID=A0A1G6GDR6_9ACTN|nr:cytochrome c oxidase subunit 2 [Raineyella antarctica]